MTSRGVVSCFECLHSQIRSISFLIYLIKFLLEFDIRKIMVSLKHLCFFFALSRNSYICGSNVVTSPLPRLCGSFFELLVLQW